jgi:hypothetical protein
MMTKEFNYYERVRLAGRSEGYAIQVEARWR